MERALSAPLALILFTLARFISALSAQNITSEVYIPHRAHVDNFVQTIMRLLDIRLSAGYCCDRFCFCSDVDNATAEHCGAIEDRVATLPPSVCASGSHNSIPMVCPPSVAGTLCNGGASCCTDSYIEPCTSKLDACACPCNHCSTCSCCKRLENQLCQLRCRPCDKVWMMLDFQDLQGKPHSVNFSQNFSLNSAESRNFYLAHQGEQFILGFFKPDDPNIVNVFYSEPFLDVVEDLLVGSSWAALGAFTAFPIFTVSVILTGLLIALLLQKTRRADQRPFRIAWSVNRGLWMGIIWPLIILLLILQVRHTVMSRGTVLSILFPQQVLACIGWLPLLLLWLYHIIHPQL